MSHSPGLDFDPMLNYQRRYTTKKMVELEREKHRRLTGLQRSVSQSGVWVSIVVAAVVCFLLYSFVFTGNEKMFWVLLFFFLVYVGYYLLHGVGKNPQAMASFI